MILDPPPHTLHVDKSPSVSLGSDVTPIDLAGYDANENWD